MPPSFTPSLDLDSLKAYDYDLPQSLIAQYPLPQRDDARMLVLNRQNQTIEHHTFKQLPTWLRANDTLVFNNAKVMPARLIGHREGFDGQVELFLMNPKNDARTQWDVLMKPAKKLRPGTHVCFPGAPLSAVVEAQLPMGHGMVTLKWPDSMTFDEALAQTGHMPIPSYMARDAEALDIERYQTVFAKVPGAQAAPTAGLHFTQATLDQLDNIGVQRCEVTLWVSSGTFRPILSENIQEHTMDAERYELDEAVAQHLQQAKHANTRVFAVGTTALKTLESVAHKHHGQLVIDSDWSTLFIKPGFPFQVVDGLLTNFHLPKSTLLMLVSAFAGHDLIMEAYRQAIEQNYRFYSYGDCMLIL